MYLLIWVNKTKHGKDKSETKSSGYPQQMSGNRIKKDKRMTLP